MNTIDPPDTAENIGVRAPERTGEDHANVNFPPPFIHGTAILLAAGMGMIYPLTLPLTDALWLLGQLVLLLALVVAVASFREFRRARNPVPPNQPIRGLMMDGPFRYSRNPLYLTLALIHTAVALVAANGWILLSLAPTLLIIRYYVIAREEAYLGRRFGAAYEAYRARVRRWF